MCTVCEGLFPLPLGVTGRLCSVIVAISGHLQGYCHTQQAIKDNVRIVNSIRKCILLNQLHSIMEMNLVTWSMVVQVYLLFYSWVMSSELGTCPKCTNSHHPAHALIMIRAFALHPYIL